MALVFKLLFKIMKIYFYFFKNLIANSLLCDFPQDPGRDEHE